MVVIAAAKTPVGGGERERDHLPGGGARAVPGAPVGVRGELVLRGVADVGLARERGAATTTH